MKRWKDIPGYEGIYKISDHGDILNIITGKLRTLKPRKNGYIYVDLYKNGIVSWKRVHRLVAICFVDNPNNYDIVMHLDNDKTNNIYTNLRWGTVSDNTKQAYDDGLLYDVTKTYVVYKNSSEITCIGLKEVMELLGYSKSSVCDYIKSGKNIKKGKYKDYKIRIE